MATTTPPQKTLPPDTTLYLDKYRLCCICKSKEGYREVEKDPSKSWCAICDHQHCGAFFSITSQPPISPKQKGAAKDLPSMQCVYKCGNSDGVRISISC